MAASVIQVRDFYDLRQIKTNSILGETKYFASANVYHEQLGRISSKAVFSAFWKNEFQIPAKKTPSNSGLFSAKDKERVLKFLLDSAHSAGFLDISFNREKNLSVSSEAVSIPALSFAGCLVWEKIDPAEFRKGVSEAFKLFESIRRDSSDAYLEKLSPNSQQRLVFALGLLVGGVDFIVAYPSVSAENTSGILSEIIGKFSPIALEKYLFDQKYFFLLMLNSPDF
jgi:hypothetical protein